MNKKKISPRFVRFAVLTLVSLTGCIGLFLTRFLFEKAIGSSSLESDVLLLTHDNFYLYFGLSSVLAAVLFFLTLISALVYIFGKNCGTFFTLTAKASPIASSFLMLAVALFYVYLTSGGQLSIAAYVACVGLCEALVLLFPLALTGLKKKKTEPSQKNKTSKKKGSR